MGGRAHSAHATLRAQRLDRLPNRDEDGYISASILMNASLEYAFQEALSARIIIDNLADKDPTYASYPYYDVSWFDSLGRTVYFTVNYKFGGQ